jgi:HrpA-like RNA helicase
VGILLRQLTGDSKLDGVSHIFVDEVHERDKLTDFLLIILRDILPTRPDLKLVLMSATINADLFSKYFGNAPMFSIPGQSFPVQHLFLEDVLHKTGYKPKNNGRFARGRTNGGGRGGGGMTLSAHNRPPSSPASLFCSFPLSVINSEKQLQQQLQDTLSNLTSSDQLSNSMGIAARSLLSPVFPPCLALSRCDRSCSPLQI